MKHHHETVKPAPTPHSTNTNTQTHHTQTHHTQTHHTQTHHTQQVKLDLAKVGFGHSRFWPKSVLAKEGEVFNIGTPVPNHSDKSTSSNCSQLLVGKTAGIGHTPDHRGTTRMVLAACGTPLTRPWCNVVNTSTVSNNATVRPSCTPLAKQTLVPWRRGAASVEWRAIRGHATCMMSMTSSCPQPTTQLWLRCWPTPTTPEQAQNFPTLLLPKQEERQMSDDGWDGGSDGHCSHSQGQNSASTTQRGGPPDQWWGCRAM